MNSGCGLVYLLGVVSNGTCFGLAEDAVWETNVDRLRLLGGFGIISWYVIQLMLTSEQSSNKEKIIIILLIIPVLIILLINDDLGGTTHLDSRPGCTQILCQSREKAAPELSLASKSWPRLLEDCTGYWHRKVSQKPVYTDCYGYIESNARWVCLNGPFFYLLLF